MNFRPSLQFRLRTLFVAVAVISVACAYYRNYRFCMDRAGIHRESESDWTLAFRRERALNEYNQMVGGDSTRGSFEGECYEKAQLQKRLREQYESAAIFPWARFWIDPLPKS
jgi:hypothetical protein